ncbi:MAG: response regulator [Nitrospinae bacterium]|nr:response regulator [Nitrospinota bacterium]
MKKKLLVVDDDDILELLNDFLSSQGFMVATARSGKEGLEKYGTDFDGLVITDLDMPGMNGMEFLKRLKEKDPDCIGIILTGKGSMDTCVTSLREELAYDYLMKPLENLDLLLSACRRAWEKKELELQKRGLMASLKKSNAELLETIDQLKKTQNELIDSKRMLALTEMAGAVAHEISNPLCAIVTNIEVLLKIAGKDHPHYKILNEVLKLLDRVAKVMDNIRSIRSYKTKPYLNDYRIIDLEESAENSEKRVT